MVGSWAGRILYFDTHAGRGKHAAGQYGSPLVALKTYLDHKHRGSIFRRCEVFFFFFEIDERNCKLLRSEIDGFGDLPKQVKVKIACGDCFEALRSVVKNLKESGSRIAPAFIFVDPYGFKVPTDILHDLMNFDFVELFVNVIWRELSMAIAQGDSCAGMARTLDLIFNGNDWRNLVGVEFDAQADACVNLLQQKIAAKWSTSIRMLGPNDVTRYMLLHFTNHDAGRDLMKNCYWKVCPEGGFFVRARDNAAQQYLITPSPDLTPLKNWVIKKLTARPMRWQDLIKEVRPEIWRKAQLNTIVRELRHSNVVDGRNYQSTRRFEPKQNPELYLLKTGIE
jgi:three-Cys-motif partner protein